MTIITTMTSVVDFPRAYQNHAPSAYTCSDGDDDDTPTVSHHKPVARTWVRRPTVIRRRDTSHDARAERYSIRTRSARSSVEMPHGLAWWLRSRASVYYSLYRYDENRIAARTMVQTEGRPLKLPRVHTYIFIYLYYVIHAFADRFVYVDGVSETTITPPTMNDTIYIIYEPQNNRCILCMNHHRVESSSWTKKNTRTFLEERTA